MPLVGGGEVLVVVGGGALLVVVGGGALLVVVGGGAGAGAGIGDDVVVGAGARLVEVWPLVPIYHMLGLNLAAFSYDGGIHFGLVADPTLLEDVAGIAADIEAEAAALVAQIKDV